MPGLEFPQEQNITQIITVTHNASIPPHDAKEKRIYRTSFIAPWSTSDAHLPIVGGNQKSSSKHRKLS